MQCGKARTSIANQDNIGGRGVLNATAASDVPSRALSGCAARALHLHIIIGTYGQAMCAAVCLHAREHMKVLQACGSH